jgi:peptidoglycan/LPS O-acetylase OafA/YrhL
MIQKIISFQKQAVKNNFNSLDPLLALRGFACLAVVVLHCNPPRNSLIYKGYDLTWIIFPSGGVAVWIFFCLSGYLMGKAFYTERYSIDVSGVLNFWRNRILRIFPLYYFSSLILALFVYPEIFKIENWGYLVRILTFTYNHSLPVGVNGVLWSLATEVQFYVCVPFIYTYLKAHLFNRRQIVLALGYIIFFVFILRLFSWISFYPQFRTNGSYIVKYWYAPLIMNLDIFLCGFLVNPWLKYKKHTPDEQEIITSNQSIFTRLSTKTIAVVLFLALYLFTGHYQYHLKILTSTSFFILQPLTALITCFFIISFELNAYKEVLVNENLSFVSILKNPIRILEIFGNLSYGVYIWHESIIEKLAPIFTSDIPIEAFYARLTATLVLSTLLAAVSYYLVELPAARWKIYRQSETGK